MISSQWAWKGEGGGKRSTWREWKKADSPHTSWATSLLILTSQQLNMCTRTLVGTMAAGGWLLILLPCGIFYMQSNILIFPQLKNAVNKTQSTNQPFPEYGHVQSWDINLCNSLFIRNVDDSAVRQIVENRELPVTCLWTGWASACPCKHVVITSWTVCGLYWQLMGFGSSAFYVSCLPLSLVRTTTCQHNNLNCKADFMKSVGWSLHASVCAVRLIASTPSLYALSLADLWQEGIHVTAYTNNKQDLDLWAWGGGGSCAGWGGRQGQGSK